MAILLGTALSLAQIDRGIYEAIRKELVRRGYLPDQTLFATQALFETAKNILRESLPHKQLIEVMGIGTSEARDTFKLSSIYISRMPVTPGSIGSRNRITFDEYTTEGGEKKFEKKEFPENNFDIPYEIRYYTEKTDYDRVIIEVILSALGQRGRIRSINPDGSEGKKFHLEYTGGVDLSSARYFERLARYTAKDIHLVSPTVLKENVAAITEIKLEIGENNTLINLEGV